MTKSQPYTFDRVVRLIIGAIMIGAILWLINVLRGVLLPFCVACLIAYLCEPFVQFNRKLLHLKGRVGAIFVTLFEVCFFITVACYFLVPSLIEEFHALAAMMNKYAGTDFKIEFVPDEFHQFIRRNIDFNTISEYLRGIEWSSLIDRALSTTWRIISGSIAVIMSVFSWMIVVLYVIFIMIDYDRLGAGMRRMIPARYRKPILRVAGDVKDSMNRYFRGQALVAFIVGILFAIGFSIIGLPLAIAMGLFIGLLNMVPYLQLISIVPVGLICLIYSVGGGGNFWTLALECLIVYCVVQAIQDLYLTPKIMGKAMGLNPAIILLSLSVWGTLLGFLGLIIALPLTTLLLSYYDRYIIEAGEKKQPVDSAPTDSDEHSPDAPNSPT